MKVVICWPDVSGYSAACWKALSRRVELFVLTRDLRPPSTPDSPHSTFDFGELITGVPHRILTRDEFPDAGLIERVVAGQRPDVVVLPGWAIANYNRLASAGSLRSAKFVMAMDTAWTGSLRQLAGRWVKRGYFRHIDGVMTAGERSARLARVLGFEPARIERGVYGIDYSAWEGLHGRRAGLAQWPRKFVFVGRFIPDKAIDVLVAGYAAYRGRVPDPWPLTCCGRGPDGALLRGREGVTDLGFVQPAELAGVFAEHGCLVLPSRYEPWGVVLAEAAAAGLPLIATDICGASVDLLRHYYNGVVMRTPDARELADAMAWVHENAARLAEMGARSRVYAAAYAAEVWAERWEGFFRLLT